VDFPTKWEYLGILLAGEKYVDTNVFESKGHDYEINLINSGRKCES
jgi:hypothetical protein